MPVLGFQRLFGCLGCMAVLLLEHVAGQTVTCRQTGTEGCGRVWSKKGGDRGGGGEGGERKLGLGDLNRRSI